MGESLPISLAVVYIAFFGFLNTHQRHATRFEGASRAYHMALYGSLILGSLVGLGLLIYYGVQTAWYWPIVLFLIGSVLGGLIFAFLDVSLGLLVMSLASFLGWPICAYIMYKIIRHLGP